MLTNNWYAIYLFKLWMWQNWAKEQYTNINGMAGEADPYVFPKLWMWYYCVDLHEFLCPIYLEYYITNYVK